MASYKNNKMFHRNKFLYFTSTYFCNRKFILKLKRIRKTISFKKSCLMLSSPVQMVHYVDWDTYLFIQKIKTKKTNSFQPTTFTKQSSLICQVLAYSSLKLFFQFSSSVECIVYCTKQGYSMQFSLLLLLRNYSSYFCSVRSVVNGFEKGFY